MQTGILNRLATISVVVLAFLLAGCGSVVKNETVMLNPDPHSFSRPHEARVNHLDWTAAVDFDLRVIKATAKWRIESTRATEIVFDTKDLVIDSVATDDNPNVSWRLTAKDSVFGQALVVPITPETSEVTIRYSTSQQAEALQWLSPQQTAGKREPFLFTQSQAILARSWVPCQDSPGVRFTYNATVKVPPQLLALMSATNPLQKNNSGEYRFEMKQAIPSYLLALAVGDLSFEAISDRSGVYAEPATLNAATYEFADLEKMIAGAEKLYGPYQWERYDVLVLPPSFPFGGMENPRLTFATPTILAGDRSLTSLIAHELAHSWSGNLVTNANWNDFWLNEGFTVYFETRIMEELYGRDYAEMLASLNLQELRDEINALNGKGLSADTRLKLDLTGRNPDDGVTSIAYNKGYFFLRTIEERYGREKFDAFLKDYFAHHAFGSIDTESFTQYIVTYYDEHFQVKIDSDLFQQWIYSEGLPENSPQPQSDRFREVDQVLALWQAGRGLDMEKSKQWTTHEWLHFLNNLPGNLTTAQMQELDAYGQFTASHNAEIITVWGVIAIRNNYDAMLPVIEEFLIRTGRRKFLSPLYEELIKTPEGHKRARKIYEQAKPNYHFVATSTLDKIIL